MKKILVLGLILVLFFVNGSVLAHEGHDHGVSPVVSIGTGNGNLPDNTGPIHGTIYSGGLVDVYATIDDTDLDNYHFRIVKSGGGEGHTCTEDNGLFLTENQGYASTTLNKETCGFNFNQSVYVSGVGFTNSLIATIDTADLVAFGGEGDYFLIIGALDIEGNRSSVDYLHDARVMITIDSSHISTSTNSTTASVPTSSSGTNLPGGGGNGPIVNSFGFTYPTSVSNPTSQQTSTDVENQKYSNNFSAPNQVASIDTVGFIEVEIDNNVSSGTESFSATTSTTTESVIDNSEQLAQVSSSGFDFGWFWWALLIILIGGSIYYFLIKK